MNRLAVVCLALLAAACGPAGPEPKRYELNGQILALAPERREVTIRHDDIVNFMPAMTMTFTVGDASLLDGKQPGDLVIATLVVGEVGAHLSTVTTTGHQELEEAPPAERTPVLREGDPVSDASFIDQDGEPLTLVALRGHRLALTFIYTRCPLPEFCPLMNRHFAAVQTAIRSREDLQDVRLLSVTLDPEYDQPPVLKAQADAFGADPAIWSFLTTGTIEALHPFGTQFGLYSEVDAADPAQTVHNLRTVVIGADGRLATIHTGNDWTATGLLADLTAAPAPAH
jgi:protein SCO1/2